MKSNTAAKRSISHFSAEYVNIHYFTQKGGGTVNIHTIFSKEKERGFPEQKEFPLTFKFYQLNDCTS